MAERLICSPALSPIAARINRNVFDGEDNKEVEVEAIDDSEVYA